MLLFLDIDGVMVPAKSWKSPKLLEDGFAAFSNQAVSVLQRLVSVEVTVILTTSHKSNFSVQEWKQIFVNRGVVIPNLKLLPHNSSNLNRKQEIVNWFKLNDSDEDFIIIDDDTSLNELPGTLKNKLVQTSSYIGLTEAHLDQTHAILRKNSPT